MVVITISFHAIYTPFELFERWTDSRLPLCDVIDRGDKYEINFEIPGINEEKIDVRATNNHVLISAAQTEIIKERVKNTSTAKDLTSHLVNKFHLQKKLYLLI